MARKKNYSIFISVSKAHLYLKENKLYVVAFILLLLTIKFNCGWKEGKFNLSLECNPLSVSDIKEVKKVVAE